MAPIQQVENPFLKPFTDEQKAAYLAMWTAGVGLMIETRARVLVTEVKTPDGVDLVVRSAETVKDPDKKTL